MRPAATLDPDGIECKASTITVIIPVYDDFEATRACLISVEAAVKITPGAQILVIDDASPNQAIKTFLSDFASSRPNHHLRSHAANQGYIGSINHALRLVTAGDVVLLNSDTKTPPDFLRQLGRLSQNDPTIGTINPLSNNGEFVSFPRPYTNNEIDETRFRSIRLAAQKLNLAAVDIPSGTGFCLYVTRACLDAIGGLATEFKNGYLEDADFGLRAREAGFRNICAPAVHVAHLGSRSFQSAKSALVARNRNTLARRFPGYEGECDAFVAMDPLSAARSAIEESLQSGAKRRCLIGPRRLEPALRERARRLAKQGVDSLLILFERNGAGWKAALRASDDASPQSLSLPVDENIENFLLMVARRPSDRVELTGLAELPASLCERIFDVIGPLDLLVVEAIWRQTFEAAPGPCAETHESTPCAPCRPVRNVSVPSPVANRWRLASAKAEAAIGLDSMSGAACGAPAPVKRPVSSPRRPRDIDDPQNLPGLGVVMPYETPETLRLMLAMSEGVARWRNHVFILGQTSIDDRLIAKGLFVTGAIHANEIGKVARQYRIGRYFLPYRLSGHWALENYRELHPAPAAYFNWAPASFACDTNDLALNPSFCDRKVASSLCNWMK